MDLDLDLSNHDALVPLNGERPKRKARELAERTIHLQYKDPFQVKRMGFNYFGDVHKWRPEHYQSSQEGRDRDFVPQHHGHGLHRHESTSTKDADEEPATPVMCHVQKDFAASDNVEPNENVIRITKLDLTPVLPEVSAKDWYVRRLLKQAHVESRIKSLMPSKSRKNKSSRNPSVSKQRNREKRIIVSEPNFVNVAKRVLPDSAFTSPARQQRKRKQKTQLSRKKSFTRKVSKKYCIEELLREKRKASQRKLKQHRQNQNPRKPSAPPKTLRQRVIDEEEEESQNNYNYSQEQYSQPMILSQLQNNNTILIESSPFKPPTLKPQLFSSTIFAASKSRQKAPKKPKAPHRFQDVPIDEYPGFLTVKRVKYLKMLDLDPAKVFDVDLDIISEFKSANSLLEAIWMGFKEVQGFSSLPQDKIKRWNGWFAEYFKRDHEDIVPEMIRHMDRYNNLSKSGTVNLSQTSRNVLSIMWFMLISQTEGDELIVSFFEFVTVSVFTNPSWFIGKSIAYGSMGYFVICSLLLYFKKCPDGISKLMKFILSHVDCNSKVAVDTCWNFFRFIQTRDLMHSSQEKSFLLLSILRKVKTLIEDISYINAWLKRIKDYRKENSASVITLEILMLFRDVLLESTHYHGFTQNMISFEDGCRFSKLLLKFNWMASSYDTIIQDFASMPAVTKEFFENFVLFFHLLKEHFLLSDVNTRKRIVSRMFMLTLPKVMIDVTSNLKETDFCRITYICICGCFFLNVDSDELLKLEETSFIRLIDLNKKDSCIPEWIRILFITSLVICIKRLGSSAVQLSNELFAVTKTTISSILSGDSLYTNSREVLQMIFVTITEIIDKNDPEMFWWLIDPGLSVLLRGRTLSISAVQQNYMKLVITFTKIFWKQMKLSSIVSSNLRKNIAHVNNLIGSLESFILNQFSGLNNADESSMQSVNESIHIYVLLNALINSVRPFNLKAILDKYGLEPYWVTKSSLRYHSLHRMRVLAAFQACMTYHSFSRAEWQNYSSNFFSVWIRSFLDPLMQSNGNGSECFKQAFNHLNKSMFENEYFAIEFEGITQSGNIFPEILIHLSLKYESEFSKPDARKSTVRSKYVGILTEILHMLGIGITEAGNDNSLLSFYSNIVLDVMRHCSSLVYHPADHTPLIDVIDKDFMKNQKLLKLRNYRDIRKTYFLCIGKYQIISDEMLRRKVTDLYLVLLDDSGNEKDLYLDLLMENSNFALQTSQWIISAVIPQIYGKWYQEYNEAKQNGESDASRLLEPPRKCIIFLKDLMLKCISSIQTIDDTFLICLQSCILDVFSFSQKPLKPHSDNAPFQIDFIRFLETMAKFVTLNQRRKKVSSDSISFYQNLMEMQLFKSIEYTAKLIPGLKSLRSIVQDLERPIEWFIQDIAEFHEHAIRERSFKGEPVPNSMLKNEFESELLTGKIKLRVQNAKFGDSEKKVFARNYLSHLYSFWKQTAQISPKLSDQVALGMVAIDQIKHDSSNDFSKYATKHGLFEESGSVQNLLNYDEL